MSDDIRHDADNEEQHGLPSVNRRKRNTKGIALMAALLVVIVALLSAVMYFADSGKEAFEKKRSERAETVSNKLPKISFATVRAEAPPPTKPPAPRVDLSESQIPETDKSKEAEAPRKPPKAKKSEVVEQTWYDRKMLGDLVVGGKGGSVRAARPVGTSQVPTGTGAAMPGAFYSQPRARPVSGAGTGSASGFSGDNKSSLGSRLQPTKTPMAQATVLKDLSYLVLKGATLDCVLETALDSTVPGLTTCRLTRDIYSANGKVLLMDRGSQLVGEYQSDIEQGQARLFVLWSRLVTPHGVAIELNSPGTDALGRSGVSGFVDNHFFQRFGSAILLSLVQGATQSDTNTNGGTTNYYGEAGSSGGQIIERMLDDAVNIPPTLIKNQGDHIQVMVARDLDFSGVYSLQVQ